MAYAYSREGLFGANASLYERKPGVWGRKRGRMRLGCLTMSECVGITLVLMCALLAVVPAWFLAGHYGMLERDARGMALGYRWYVEFVMSLVTFYGITLAMGTLFIWHGELSRYDTWVFRTSVIIAFGLCYEKRPMVAAVVVSANGAFVRYFGRSEGDRSLRHGFYVGVVALALMTVLCGVYQILVPVVLCPLGKVLDAGIVNRNRTVNQSLVRVDNSALPQSQDKKFATLVAPLSYQAVPDEIMAVVTCAGGCHLGIGNDVEFRRWAALGDAALALAVNVYGFEEKATVAVISQWKQKCLSRNAMFTSVDSNPMVKGRFVTESGVFVSNVAAEAFEAMVGAAWYYDYGCGSDAKWLSHSRDLMISKLGLPKSGRT